MALLAYATPAIAGTTLTMAAASAGGDTIPSSRTGVIQMDNTGTPTRKITGILVVTNGDATSTDVTIVVPGTAADKVIAVAAGATKLIGPLGDELEDSADDLIDITYSKVTSLTVGAIKL